MCNHGTVMGNRSIKFDSREPNKLRTTDPTFEPVPSIDKQSRTNSILLKFFQPTVLHLDPEVVFPHNQ